MNKLLFLAAAIALAVSSGASAQTAPTITPSPERNNTADIIVTGYNDGTGHAIVPSLLNGFPVNCVAGCSGSPGSGGGLGGIANTSAPTLTNGQTVTTFYFDLLGNVRTLATIAGPIPGGSNTIGGVTIADGGDATLGAKGDSAAGSDTATASSIALIKRLLQSITILNGKLDALHTDFIAATPAGELHIGEVGGRSIVTGGTFTTPSGTTAYASGNLIGNSGTAGSVTPVSVAACRVPSGSGMIRRIRYTTTDTGFAGATVRVHLYKDTPTASNGDHAAWLTTQSTYIGAFDVTLDRHFTDAEKGVGAPLVGGEVNFDCATGTQVLFALVEARGAITPQGAKVHTIAAEIIQN